MSVRAAFSALCLVPILTAQEPTPAKPSPAELAQEQTGVQETVEDQLAALRRELQKVREELAYIKRLQEGGGIVGSVIERLGHRSIDHRTTEDRSVPKAAPVATPGGARLLGDEEKSALPPDTILTVNGVPATKAEFEELHSYFTTYDEGDGAGDHLKTRALEALITIKGTQSAFRKTAAIAKQEIVEVQRKLDAGGDFAEVAKELSQCPSAAQGGDLGFFGREGMDAAFSRAAFSLNVGETSGIVQSAFGYHLIKVTAKEKGETPALDKVKASHILKLYSPDQVEVRQVMSDAMAGKMDVAFTDDEWRKIAPYSYRRQ